MDLSFFSRQRAKIKDVSFMNLFFKRFAITLAIASIFLVFFYFVSQSIVVESQKSKIKGQISEIALNLAQLEDDALAQDQMSLLVNVWLSKYQEVLQDNEFIVDSSLSFYDLTNQTAIAKSFQIPIIQSEEAMLWWSKEADVDIGVPHISLSNEMLEFCKQHKDKDLYINKMVFVNSVLFPSEIVVLDNKGDVVEKCTAVTPSAPTEHRYEKKVKMELIGNNAEDGIYLDMVNFNFSTEDLEDEDGDKLSTQVKLFYLSNLDKKDYIVENVIFNINDVDYQLDCIYQFNFWVGVWRYVLIAEFAVILLSAFFSFLTTKDTYDVIS